MSALSCMRKRRYSSESAAWSVIFKLRARGQDTERLKPYCCEVCRGWHLGHVPAGPPVKVPPRILRNITGERAE